jgi:hypothetical protein
MRAYGITDPHRLYVSDSTEEGILKYDTRVKRCATCYVDTYRVGYVSVRRAGETWEHAERRVETTAPRDFLDGTSAATTTLSTLDPDVAPLAEAMLQDARRAGFRIHVIATYRSPLREAYLMALGSGRTHTLTSNHSYGRALDIVVGDGRLVHAQTRQEWIAFRAWVIRYRTPAGESFRILGEADRSWDWAHVEFPAAHLGFRTIAEAIRRGRACLAQDSKVSCFARREGDESSASAVNGRDDIHRGRERGAGRPGLVPTLPPIRLEPDQTDDQARRVCGGAGDRLHCRSHRGQQPLDDATRSARGHATVRAVSCRG